jgi:hypothetical protein
MELKMAQLCKLPIAESIQGTAQASAWVNPLLVRFVRSGAGDQTVVSFDHQHSLSIAQPLEKVRLAIDEALKQ